MPEDSRLSATLDRGERLLESYSTRFFLSLLIIVSVLPDAVLRTLFSPVVAERLWIAFLLVFVPEFALRSVLYVRRWREQRASLAEPPLLALDLLAIISFLPLQALIQSHYFRLFRLARMLLLLGYWGGMVRQLWAILSGPDRRHQVLMVVFLGIVLSFGSSVLLVDLSPDHDFNGDGTVDARDRRFGPIMWWSFRQVQDPGNLVADLGDASVVAFSLLLTFTGLLLLSFVIGIGTGAVEELLQRSRAQPLALDKHTVILGLTPYSRLLLEGLAEIYRKNLRPFRVAVLGEAAETPAYLHQPALRSFHYRSGEPTLAADLDRVNVRRAKRVLILGSDPRNPDTEVIASILASRERNGRVPLYPDLEHERHFEAARAAGGAHTHVVGSGSFLGFYIAHNVAYPGCYRLYRQLLTCSGCEIYTYVFSAEERARRGASAAFDPRALHRLAYRRWGITLIGLFTAEDPAAALEIEDFDVLLNPVAAARRGGYAFDAAGRVRWTAVRGLIGITLRWADMRRLGRALVEQRALAGGEEPAAPADFEPPRLSASRERVERVLISGASLRVPRVVTQLVKLYRVIEITVVLAKEARFAIMARRLQTMLVTELGEPPAVERRVGAVRFRVTAAGADARVCLVATDWDDHAGLREERAVTLETADAVLLLPGASRTEELDGAVALDCLRLAQLDKSGAIELRPDLRLVGMVRDPLKVELLESRLRQITGGDGERYTIISSELARHFFIMQNVFVWGLNPVFLRLLSFSGPHLARLVPAWDGAAATFDPWDLAEHLLAERGEVFVGLELESGEVETDPRRLAPGTSIARSSVRALYVLSANAKSPRCSMRVE